MKAFLKNLFKRTEPVVVETSKESLYLCYVQITYFIDKRLYDLTIERLHPPVAHNQLQERVEKHTKIIQQIYAQLQDLGSVYVNLGNYLIIKKSDFVNACILAEKYDNRT